MPESRIAIDSFPKSPRNRMRSAGTRPSFVNTILKRPSDFARRAPRRWRIRNPQFESVIRLAARFGYHAVPTNTNVLSAFRVSVMMIWHRTRRRRSQKDRTRWRKRSTMPNDGFRHRASSIHGPTNASPSSIRGGSRVRESCMLGSDRGAGSNARPDGTRSRPSYVMRKAPSRCVRRP